MQDEGAGGDKVPMPELQHNLQLLVDLAEADIQKLDARLRHEQDTATLLGREKTRLEEEVSAGWVVLLLLVHILLGRLWVLLGGWLGGMSLLLCF